MPVNTIDPPRRYPPAVTGEKMRTWQAAQCSGASYRQIDYWSRIGVFSGATVGRGSGTQRLWDEAQVVLARALVLVSRLVTSPNYPVFQNVEQGIRVAQTGNPLLVSTWIIVTPEKVTVGPLVTPEEVAMVVGLASCVRYVHTRTEELVAG